MSECFVWLLFVQFDRCSFVLFILLSIYIRLHRHSHVSRTLRDLVAPVIDLFAIDFLSVRCHSGMYALEFGKRRVRRRVWNCRQNRSPKFFLAQLITMDLFFKNIFLSLALRYLFDRYLLPSSQYAEHTSSERFERFERFPNGALIVSNCDHINDQLIDRLFTSSNSAAV